MSHWFVIAQAYLIMNVRSKFDGVPNYGDYIAEFLDKAKSQEKLDDLLDKDRKTACCKW